MADPQRIESMEGQVTRAEAIGTIRGFQDTLPEESPYRGLTNQQIMECFPFEDRRLFVARQDAAVPSEVVPREDVAAVIDVLGIYAEDARAITNLIDPFQEIQEDVRALTSERIVRRTDEERADLMYLAEKTDPQYNRSVADYARLRPDAVDNVSFGRAIRAIKARAPDWNGVGDIPDELGQCSLCLDNKPIYAFHLSIVGPSPAVAAAAAAAAAAADAARAAAAAPDAAPDAAVRAANAAEYAADAAARAAPTPHTFLCINCVLDHFNDQTVGPNIECFERPGCRLSLYEHIIYKTVIRAPEAERNDLLARLNDIITTRRTNFQQKKNRLNIFDDESDADMYLEHFFRSLEVPRVDIDNMEIIRLELQRRGLILTAEQLLEKIEEYNNRLDIRIRGILTELIDEEDHEVSDEDLEIARESLGLIGIDTTVEQLRATLTLIDRQKAEEFGINVDAVIESRRAEHARKREVVEKRRAEGAQARAARAQDAAAQAQAARRERTIAEIQRLREAGQRVAIDWTLNGKAIGITFEEKENGTTGTLERTHICPYCYQKEEFLVNCAFVKHQNPHTGNAVPCPSGYAHQAEIFYPFAVNHVAPMWCRICCRPAGPGGHDHSRIDGRGVEPRPEGGGRDIYGFDNAERACINNGGGGRVEFLVRVFAIRDQILEDLNNGLYVYDLAMKGRIFNRTMSNGYLGAVQRWKTRVPGSEREPNIVRALDTIAQGTRDSRSEATLKRFRERIAADIERMHDARRRGVEGAQANRLMVSIVIPYILDPPKLLPDWIPKSKPHRFVGGSRSKTVRRQTYKKRSKNKQSRRSKYSRK